MKTIIAPNGIKIINWKYQQNEKHNKRDLKY